MESNRRDVERKRGFPQEDIYFADNIALLHFIHLSFKSTRDFRKNLALNIREDVQYTDSIS